MKLILFFVLMFGCGEEIDPNKKYYTTELACGLDGENVTFYTCKDSREGSYKRSCNGPSLKELIENPGYYCSGSLFSVSEIKDDPFLQWEFPVGVPTPVVRWSTGTAYVPKEYFGVHTALIPFFFWPQRF